MGLQNKIAKRTKNSNAKKDFPGGSDSKESACNAGDQGSIPESRRFPGEGNGYTLQYFCLENSMAREAWQAIQSMVLQRFGYDLSD